MEIYDPFQAILTLWFGERAFVHIYIYIYTRATCIHWLT